MKKGLDYKKVFEVLIDKLSDYLTKNNLKSMVLEVDGSLESVILAAVCYEVSLKTKIPVIGRSLPINESPEMRTCAKLIGKSFCSDFEEIALNYPYTEYLRTLAIEEYKIDLPALESLVVDCQGLESKMKLQTKTINENIQARLRTIYLYNIAGITKGIVIGSLNATDYYLGNYTIGGDKLGDINLIGGMYKSELDNLAFSITERYQEKGEVHKVNSFCISQSFSGLTKEEIEVDEILKGLNTEKTVEELTKEFDSMLVGRVADKYTSSRFKRNRIYTSYFIGRELYEEDLA